MAHNGVHFAIHADDVERARRFHQAVFGWRGTGVRAFTCTVAVDDLDAVRERVMANGGTILHHEIEIPTVGTLTELLDPEGNEVVAMVYQQPTFGM